MTRRPGQRPTTRRWLSIATVVALAACAPGPSQTQVSEPSAPGGVGGTGATPVPAGVGGTGVVAERPGGVGGTGIQGGEPGGVGGTGVVAGGAGGVGGTGIYGTITGFGSIIVNGIHIETPQAVPVRTIFGARPPGELRIGQVVSVIADGDGSRLTARDIELDLAAVGPVSAIDRESGTIEVLGQTVRVDAGTRLGDPGSRDFGGLEGLRVGDTITVSGLHGDGYLQASRIDRRTGDTAVSLSGPVSRIDGDAVFIGNQRLEFADGRPAGLEVGRRARVVGVVSGNALRAYQTDVGPATPFAGRVKRLSVEGLVSRARSGRDFRIGGLRVGREALGSEAVGRRAVINGEVTRDRSVRIDRARFIDRARGGGNRRGLQNDRRGTERIRPGAERRRIEEPSARPATGSERDRRSRNLRRDQTRPGATGQRNRIRRDGQNRERRQGRVDNRRDGGDGIRRGRVSRDSTGTKPILKRRQSRDGTLRRTIPRTQRGTDFRRTQRRPAAPTQGNRRR